MAIIEYTPIVLAVVWMAVRLYLFPRTNMGLDSK
jgi:hypothetical protein